MDVNANHAGLAQQVLPSMPGPMEQVQVRPLQNNSSGGAPTSGGEKRKRNIPNRLIQTLASEQRSKAKNSKIVRRRSLATAPENDMPFRYSLEGIIEAVGEHYNLGQLTERVDGMDDRLEAVEGSLKTLETRVESLEEEVKRLGTTVIRLEEKVERLEATVVRLDATVVRLDATVVRLDAKVVRLDAKVVRLEATVDRLENRMFEFDVKMNHMTDSVKNLTAKFDLFIEQVNLRLPH